LGKIIKSAEDKALGCSRFERDTLEHFASIVGDEEGRILDPAALLSEVQAEAEQIREAAREQGYNEGLETGRDAARQEVAAAIQSLTSAVEAIQQSHEEYIAQIEPELLRLVRYITERVLNRESRGDLDVVRSTIRSALKNVLDREHAVVHMSPEDIQAFADEGIDLAAELGAFERLELTPDDTVDRGGCIVETRTLSVDARLDTQLQRIFEALMD
jgi:flagellar assembly protein FliH